jgi:hypothetical protein
MICDLLGSGAASFATGASMVETRTARVHLIPDGVLVVRIRDDAHQTLVDARENLAAAVAEARSRRPPILIDIRRALPLDAEVRHHYTGQVLVQSFSALAMLAEASPVGRMMANVYLRVARPGIPTQLFTDEDRAVAWLARFRT